MSTSAANVLDHDPWVRRYHPSDRGGPRLVCFPHAGGSATAFHKLSALLAPGIEVLAVQYPGRQDRRSEPGAETIDDLAAAFTAASTAWRDRPYAFFGHSMGAVVAYEVARRLSKEGGPQPVRLFASGRRAPSRFRPGTVHLRDDAGVLDELRMLGGTDERMLADPEIVQMALGPTRSDYKAIETYREEPGFRLSCPVTVLAGTDDPHTTLDEAAAWSDHTEAACELLTFRGGHFFVDERRAEVAEAIRTALRDPAAG